MFLIMGTAVGLCCLTLYAWPQRAPLIHSIPDGEWRSSAWIGRASVVDLSHLGFHTHENKIQFDLSGLHIPRGTAIRIVAHCLYQTDKAGIDPIETWTPRNYNDTGEVLAPSRFADLVALISPYAGDAYLHPESYCCEVAWDRK
ncbi:MAG: hypothetical protein M3Y56_02430 [Armatimonadota bacterium]|nr:hypothetical protein [Armatimonadota bacterium]